MTTNVMQGYDKRTFAAPLSSGESVSHDVYERGDGPPIVLIQELPGIGMETLRLARHLIDAGHRVVMPHLFGPLGKTSIALNLARVMCMRREFALFSANQSSPVVAWLRALCRDVCARTGARGVGVIGMCLTGNFGLSLIADDSVLAAVASQPSLPSVPQRGLHLSEEEVAASCRAIDSCGPVLAFRFAGDRLCTAEKFAAIEAAFNTPEHERVALTVLPGAGHAVLTLDFVDEAGHPTHEALARVTAYFGERLGTSG